MIRALYWASVSALAYSYIVYPLVVLARGAIVRRPHLEAEVHPSVTVVVAAHNEAARIERKLRSVLAQDYPANRLEVIVASDGSDDGPPGVVAGLRRARVRVLDLPRIGKGEALAAAVAAARGEVLVFSDANSILASDAIGRLVRPFADPAIGGVAGNQVYVEAGDEEATAVGERSYWDFDRALKVAQSRSGNVIGATGALYAIRRSLFRPIPEGVNDDLFTSLAVVDAGYRLVFEPGAVAYERVAPTQSLEYRRRVRIMTRGLRCVAALPAVLDPRRTGFYALQVLSQKVLMRTMAVPLAVLALASGPLYRRTAIYRLAAWGQLVSYALAAAGLVMGRRAVGRHPVLALPAYFCTLQMASLHATWNLLRGRSLDRWEPERGQAAEPEGLAAGEGTPAGAERDAIAEHDALAERDGLAA
ncbi:MAG: glycosyltransferase [Chloroflexi bacterium]|nr:glycosyltransferase [Chloroflexota bacterium]